MMSAIGEGTVAVRLRHSAAGPYEWVNPGVGSSSDFGLIDWTALDTTLRPAGTAWFKALSHAAAMSELNLCGPATPTPRPQSHHNG